VNYMSTSEQRPAASTRSSGSRSGDRVESVSGVKFLTVAEVAATMRVSKMTVYRMVHSGELAAVRVGRSFRVPEKAVHDYLEKAFIEAG
jgi:excisionase family DNA binding protein